MVWNIYFQVEGNIRIDAQIHLCPFQICPRGSKSTSPATALLKSRSSVCHVMVPTSTPLLGLLSGTVCLWLKCHRRVCWNSVASDIPSVKFADSLKITKCFGSRDVIKWKRPAVCKETVLPLIDPDEANSPQQQTWPWNFSDQRSCLWFLAFHC